MKRITAFLLILIMLGTTIFTMSGCSTSESQMISVGQWLAMLNDSFGMYSYTSEEPYFENITEDNKYFETVQIAAEWDVIDKDGALDVDEKLTWQDALVSLVNVGNFVALNADVDEKIDYAIENFDSSIRKYWMNRKIPIDKAISLLAVAQDKWANLTYAERVENVEYAEGVKDFSTEEKCLTNYDIDANGLITIPCSENVEIAEGDVFVLPSNGEVLGVNAYKAEIIESDGENIYITSNQDELDLEDITETMYVEETFAPTMENAVIRDGNGNIVSVGSNVAVQRYNKDGEELDLYKLSTRGYDIEGLDLGVNTSHTFKVDDWSISLKYNLDGAFDLEATVETPNLRGKGAKDELKGKFAISVSDMEITDKIDIGFGHKEAVLRVDYKTKTSAGLTYKPIQDIKLAVAPKYSNGNGRFLTNLKNSVVKSEKAKGAKTIKIASVDIYSIGIARVCLDINVNISVDGSVTVTVTESGSKGIEYKNGNLRLINTTNKDLSAEIKAKIEATVGIGPALYTVGLKKPILGVQVKVGLGVEVSNTLHLIDSDNHLLEVCASNDILPEDNQVFSSMEIVADATAIKAVAESQGGTYVSTSDEVMLRVNNCTDLSVYFILKVELTDYSYVSSWLGGKIKTSWQIFGKDNAKLLNIHCDNGDWAGAFSNIAFGQAANSSRCTLDYEPFDVETEEVKETDETVDDNSIVEGEQLILEEIKASIDIGDKYYIIVEELPEGYDVDDLVCEVADPSIVSANNDGEVVGKAEGTTVVTVRTKDGEHVTGCAITVLQEQTEEFVPLEF